MNNGPLQNLQADGNLYRAAVRLVGATGTSDERLKGMKSRENGTAVPHWMVFPVSFLA
ncbi:hypothetical protein B2K_03395 [Paenibacillus mucilaginosus K02]|nr:hypothetical protein B2K_03395 [Paenibacillus mucilaginosus K02]